MRGKAWWAGIPLLLALATGCASDEVNLVNQAALAVRTSPTDSLSRKLALSTMSLMTQREEDYRIGTDDVLSVSIFEWMVRDTTKTVDVRVSESGFITLPLMGPIEVKQRTVQDVETAVVDRLVEGGFIKQPRVSVTVKEFRSKNIAVVGAVENPGRYSLRQNVATLLDAMSLAGGLDERAGYVLYVVRPRPAEERMRKELLDAAEDGAPGIINLGGEPDEIADGPGETPIDPGARDDSGIAPVDPEVEAVIRVAPEGKAGPDLVELARQAQREVIVVDLIELLEEGNLALNAVLSDGDVVYVPEAPKFFVIGFVRKPGGFDMKRPMTVLEGIAMAEGLLDDAASPRCCALKRQEESGEVILPVDLVAISQGEQPNIYLQANDILDVRQTTWKKLFVESLNTVRSMFSVGYSLNQRYY